MDRGGLKWVATDAKDLDNLQRRTGKFAWLIPPGACLHSENDIGEQSPAVGQPNPQATTRAVSFRYHRPPPPPRSGKPRKTSARSPHKLGRHRLVTTESPIRARTRNTRGVGQSPWKRTCQRRKGKHKSRPGERMRKFMRDLEGFLAEQQQVERSGPVKTKTRVQEDQNGTRS